MHNILAENGFEPNGMKEKERADMLDGILHDNRHQFGHEFKKEESASKNPLLTKYFDIEDDGVQRAFENKDSKGTSSSSELKEKDMHAALVAGSVSLQILKSENPKFEEVKQKLLVLMSAKTSMEKLTGQASDLYYQMKASTDKSCQGRASEVKAVLDKMNQHLAESRELVAVCKAVDASHDDLPKLLALMLKLCDLAMAHQDGFKVLKKRCVAMLT